jgi:hypothetical protein
VLIITLTSLSGTRFPGFELRLRVPELAILWILIAAMAAQRLFYLCQPRRWLSLFLRGMLPLGWFFYLALVLAKAWSKVVCVTVSGGSLVVEMSASARIGGIKRRR